MQQPPDVLPVAVELRSDEYDVVGSTPMTGPAETDRPGVDLADIGRSGLEVPTRAVRMAAGLLGRLTELAQFGARTGHGRTQTAAPGRVRRIDAAGAVTSRVVVIVSADTGSADTGSGDRPRGHGYGERLATLLDWSPVHLVLGADTTAVDLGARLREVVETWPVPIERMALVAVGTAGLVLRGSCGLVGPAAETWTETVSDVVLLGTPLLSGERTLLPSPVGRRFEESLAGITADQPEVAPLSEVRYTALVHAPTPGTAAIGRAIGGLLWWRHQLLGGRRRTRSLFPTAEVHEVDGDLPLDSHPEIERALLSLLA